MWWLAIALAAPLEDACAEALAAGPGVVHAIQWEGLRGLAEERGLAPVAESFHEQLSWVATSRKGTWTLYAERAPDAAPACGTFPLGHGLVLGGWRLHSTWERGKRGRFDPKGSERAFVALLEHLATKAVRPVDRFELPTPVRQTTTFRLAERSDLILSPTDGWALVQHNVVHGGDELPGGAMLMREVPADRGFAFESDAAGEVVVEVLPPLEPTPLEVDGQVRVRPADHDGPRGAHARLVLEVPEPTTLTLQASAVRDGPYRGMVLHPRVTLYDDTGVRTANIWYAEEDDGVDKAGYHLPAGRYVAVVTEGDRQVRDFRCADEPDRGLTPAAWCDQPILGGYDVVVTRRDQPPEEAPRVAELDPEEAGGERLAAGTHRLSLVPDPPPASRSVAVRSGVDVVAVLSPVGAPVGYAWEADPLAAEGGCDDSVCLFPRAPFDAVSFRVWPADDPATYGVSVLELPAPEPEVTLSPGYVVHDLRLSRASLLDPRGPFVEIAVDVPAAGTWKVGAESREGERRVELEVVSATIPWDFVPLNVLGSHTYNATWFSTDGPGRVVVRLTTCPRCLPQTVDAEVQEAEAPF